MRIYLCIATLLSLASLSSCLTRGFYPVSQQQRDYNKPEAKKAINDMHSGVLVISIPTEHRKIELLKSIVESQPNNTKKAKELQATILSVDYARYQFINDFPKYYDFSKYQLLDDTLVKAYLAGQKVLLPYELSSEDVKYVALTDSNSVFLCKATRDYDDIALYYNDGSLIPAPFPTSSQVSAGNTGVTSMSELYEAKEEGKISHAAHVINSKLHNFFLKYQDLKSAQ